MLLTKDVAKPGVYRKGNRLIGISDSDLTAMQESIGRLHQLGYKIPTWLEHTPQTTSLSYPVHATDRRAVKRVERDPFFAGWVTAGFIGDDGVFHTTTDYPDALADKLQEIGTFVSPQYGIFKDDKRGVNLPLALHHIALTHQPVDKDQSHQFHAAPNSKPDGSLQSISVSAPGKPQASGGVPPKVFQASPAGATNLIDSQNSQIPLDPAAAELENPTLMVRLSLLDAVQSGPVSFSFQDSVDVIALSQQDSGMLPPPGPGQQQQTPGTNPQQPGSQESPNKQRFLQALQALGITVDQTSPLANDEECLSRVLGILASYSSDAIKKQKTAGTGSPSGADLQEQSTVVAMSQLNTNPTSTNTQVPGTPGQLPVNSPLPGQTLPQAAVNPSISAEQWDALNGRVTQLSQALLSQDATNKSLASQNAALMSLVTTQNRSGYMNRISALRQSQRIPADKATALEQLAGAYQFSELNNGTSELDLALSIYEGLPAGAAFVNPHAGVIQMSGTNGQPNLGVMPVNQTSQFFTGVNQIPEDRVDAVLAELGYGDQTGNRLLGVK